MLSPSILISLRDLRRRPLQAILLLLGIAIGVSVAIAIDLANTSALRAFNLSTESLTGKATHQIRGGPSGIPEEVYGQLRVELGYRNSAPVIEGFGMTLDQDGQTVRLLGVDPVAETPFRDFFPSGSLMQEGFERFFTDSTAVILMHGFASQYSLSPGDSIRLQVNDQITELSILGLLGPQEETDRYIADDLFILDVAAAQELLGLEGSLSRVDLILQEDDVREIEQWLPDHLRLSPANEQVQTAENLTAAFRLNLQALSLLALFVGMFLVYNSMAFSVLQRRQIFGTLRTLGTTQAEVFFMVAMESVLIGVLGSILGIALGWILAHAALDLVTQTITDLYFVASVGDISLDRALAIKGFGLGLGASFIGAIFPAFEAATVPPAAALQRTQLESRMKASLPRLRRYSAAMLVLGGVLLAVSPKSVGGSFAGVFAILFAIALVSPEVGTMLSRIFRPLLRNLGGIYGNLASRVMARNLSRTGVAVAALMIALTVTIGVSLMIASFRTTVENWLDVTLKADLYVSSPMDAGTQPSASFDPSLQENVNSLSGIEAVEAYRTATIMSEFGEIVLTVVDAARERDASIYRFANGSPSEVWQRVREGAVIVSEPLAFQHNLNIPDQTIELTTDSGAHAFAIEAIYYDYSTDRGSAIMSQETYARYWSDSSISSLGVFLSDDSTKDDSIQLLRSLLAGSGLLIQDNQAVREAALRIFDRTFAITMALRLLAIIVAFIGIFSATMAMQIERARELSTIRALGMTKVGLTRLATLESGILGFIAGAISWPTGLLLSLLLIYVVNLRSFGWTIRLQLDAGIFLQTLLVGIGASILATLIPLGRLARRPIAASLRRE
jgi:putative ABC transport system permease protein